MSLDTPHPHRILLADDHTLLLDAFRRLLEPAFAVVATVTDGHTLLEAAHRMRPDVVVADIAMPHLNGLDACERLVADLPDMRLVFLTVSEDPDLAAEAIRRGAAGFLLKKGAASELFLALERVLAGHSYITPLILTEPAAVFVARARRGSPLQPLTLRQREVLQLLAEGWSMKEAAEILRVTPRTIAFHKYGMMDHLGLETGAELVQYAVQTGLVRPRGMPPLHG